MNKIEKNWRKYLKYINLLLKNSPSEKQFLRDVVTSGYSLNFDSSVFDDKYYTVPYRAYPDDSATTQYNAIKKMFKNISSGSIFCIKNNENNIKKIFYVVAIDYPRPKDREKQKAEGTKRPSKQNAAMRMLLKYYVGDEQFEKTEGVFKFSIFPEYPKILGINEDYESLGGYQKYKHTHIDNAFTNEDKESKNYFNIYDLRLMINQNRYSFNLITTDGQSYVNDRTGTYKENKELLINYE